MNTPRKILIVDAVRTIQEAVDNVQLTLNPNDIVVLLRPMQTVNEDIVASLVPVMDVIDNNSPFDIWILDHDLGVDEDYERVKGAHLFNFYNNCCHEKLPRELMSCSSKLG